MKKKRQSSELPKASHRKKQLTGTLEHSGVEIKISVKKPEDWAKIRNRYILHSDKLWHDFLPFLEVGHLNSIPRTKKHKGQMKIDSIKVFSAILYRFCESVKRMKQCPAFLKPLQNNSDCKYVAALLMDSVFKDYFKRYKFGHAYEDEEDMYKVEMKPFCDRKEKMATDNFYETYIKGGLKLIKNTDSKTLRELMGEVYRILSSLHMCSNISSVSFDKKAHKILSAISDALYIQFRDPINGMILKPDRSLTALEDIEFIRDVLRPIFPALPTPDGLPLLIPDFAHPSLYQKYFKK